MLENRCVLDTAGAAASLLREGSLRTVEILYIRCCSASALASVTYCFFRPSLAELSEAISETPAAARIVIRWPTSFDLSELSVFGTSVVPGARKAYLGQCV